MTNKKQSNSTSTTEKRESARTARQRDEDGNREAVAVPSNTATNNSNNIEIKFLRWGVDSLYLSYQGNLYEEIDAKLKSLKEVAQSERQYQQAKAQYIIGDHIFEVKDKGSSFFSYILEDNAFRIQLSRPNKAVPMAYVKISSEYLTHKTPQEAENALRKVLSALGAMEGGANVSRIDLFLDFASNCQMDSWDREAWVTRAAAISSYSVDNAFTGWAIGLGSVIAGRLYNKITEIIKSQKGYLIPLWKEAGWDSETPVWRMEFQFKREFLDQKDIIKLEDTLNHLNGLWSYATTEWLKLTLPNLDDKTRSRWPIHPLWLALSSVDWESSGGALKQRFDNDRSPRDAAILDRAFSAVTTWMAIHEHRDYELCIHDFFTALYHRINNRAVDFGMTFEQLVEEKVAFKARQYNSMDNTNQFEDEANAYRDASDGR